MANAVSEVGVVLPDVVPEEFLQERHQLGRCDCRRRRRRGRYTGFNARRLRPRPYNGLALVE